MAKSLRQIMRDWHEARIRMEKIQLDMPRIMGNIGVKAVKENFRLQGYDSGSGVNGWKARSAKTNKRYDSRSGVKGSVYNSGAPLLRQTNNLYNGVHYETKNKRVFIGVDKGLIPYAKRMNEGGNGVPARKFTPTQMEGPNKKILTQVKKKIISERDKAMQEFKK